MSVVRRCDACGVIGDPPYAGWLTVTSQEHGDSPRAILYGEPKIKYHVCGHGCLPELAFVKVDEFLAVKETT